MSTQTQTPAGKPLLRFAFYGAVIALALVHVFITFRGLSSPAGMEQAQMAREMARGNFFQTKVLRPYAWASLEKAGREPAPVDMQDITQPPLQPLLWAPVFKMLQPHHVYDPGTSGSVYLLDRVIACFGVTWLLLTLLWTHGAARRLFDETVAAVVVACLVCCEPLWELAVGGSPVALLMALTALAFRLYVTAIAGAHQGRMAGPPLLALGGVAGLMLLTHPLAVWLVLGLVLAVLTGLPQKKAGVLWVLLPPALVLAGWGWWMYQRCGDPLGGVKTLFQSHLLSVDNAMLQRQFSSALPPVDVGDVGRKVLGNWQAQLGELFSHLGFCLPALFFFAALLHRFRRPEAGAVRLGLGLIFLCTLLGMGLVGLPDGPQDDLQLYLPLVPALSIFGAAMLAVLWSRLKPGGNPGLWSRMGYAILAIAVTALPLASALPAQLKLGLTLRNRMFPRWPPYVPDRVSLVRKLIEPDEMLFSDAPWFVAWYADSPTAWIPVKREDYKLMKTAAEAAQSRVAGFIMTPLSTRMSYLHEAFNGPYSEWPDLLFRGPMLAFDREFPVRADFEFKVPIALVAVPVGAQENLSLQMAFYTDRPRTVKEARDR